MSDVEDQAISTNWPVRLYAGALVFALLSMLTLTVSLDGHIMGTARHSAQFGVCLVLGLRLWWAIHKREQSKLWIPYIAGMIFAVPIWIVVEPLVRSLGD